MTALPPSDSGHSPESERNSTTVELDLSRLARVLCVAMLLLAVNMLLLDIVFNRFQLIDLKAIRRAFNIQLEGSLANWVSSIIYLTTALILWLNFLMSRLRNGFWRYESLGWLCFASMFTYLAADDGAELHERVGSAMKEYAREKAVPIDGPGFIEQIVDWFPSYYWQVAFTPIFVLVGVTMLLHLYKHLAKRRYLLLVICGFGCFAIAQGLDYLEGIHYDFPELQELFSASRRTVRHYQKATEEVLEMIGMVFLTYAFSLNLAFRAKGLTLRCK